MFAGFLLINDMPLAVVVEEFSVLVTVAILFTSLVAKERD
jgi:hypothetical protein